MTYGILEEVTSICVPVLPGQFIIHCVLVLMIKKRVLKILTTVINLNISNSQSVPVRWAKNGEPFV
jgi:hypothetical protein